MVYALAVTSFLIFHEPFNTRLCPAGAIGYLRDVGNRIVVAGGEARFDWVRRYGYSLRAWFPAKRSDAQVLMLLTRANDLRVNSFEGSGSVWMHHGTYCAFYEPPPHEVYPGVPSPSPSPSSLPTPNLPDFMAAPAAS